jgi:hypothetical protein
MLILISTVFGAISGVGIWVTIGLVQPAATSSLIHNFVWGWAAEWGFFILEVATALLYYATWDKVRPRTHLLIIWLYFFAAYMSLVIIQGIISFMLTPGKWVETGSFWDAIFNPTYFPGLVMRTGICLLLAGAYMIFAALREPDGAARARRAASWPMPAIGGGSRRFPSRSGRSSSATRRSCPLSPRPAGSCSGPWPPSSCSGCSRGSSPARSGGRWLR